MDRLVLGPSLVNSCAYGDEASVMPSERLSLERAQYDKLDLVCRKLALRPGMRPLDVGAAGGAWPSTPPVPMVRMSSGS